VVEVVVVGGVVVDVVVVAGTVVVVVVVAGTVVVVVVVRGTVVVVVVAGTVVVVGGDLEEWRARMSTATSRAMTTTPRMMRSQGLADFDEVSSASAAVPVPAAADPVADPPAVPAGGVPTGVDPGVPGKAPVAGAPGAGIRSGGGLAEGCQVWPTW
jgi:hypothetical protein